MSAALRIELRAAAAGWLRSGRAGHWVEIEHIRGSVPREVGTRMLVGAAEVLGSIGGGQLEFQAIARARERLAGGETAPDLWSVSLGPTLGQCCGGAVRLRFLALSPASLADWPPEPPRFRLQLHGAGHVGLALARLLANLPCRVLWVDERAEAFEGAPSATHIQALHSEQAEAEVAAAQAGDFFLVMTHSHALDLRIARAVLQRGDFAFLGVIGSASKIAGFRQRLRERGLSESLVARLTGPIGLPGIEGKAPEVIAISVAAQLLMECPLPARNG
jgi:xanthine dehydrogenase accessory factor